MAGITFHYCWRWSLRSDVASLWPYVSDTDRFRAVTGFPSATFTEEPLPEGGSRRIGRMHKYGFQIVWEELPFEWLREREFSEEHHYRVGPHKYVRIRSRLEPRADGGTDLTYEVWARPGNVLGYPGIPIQVGVIQHFLFERAFRQMDAHVQASAAQPFQTARTPVSPAGRARLREFSTALTAAGCDSALVSRLIEHVSNAPDDQLSRMRPFDFANVWNADRYTTLELFLRATKIGLLDLSWDMLCPECRGAKHRAHGLHDVSHGAHCPSCNIDYEVDFARSVEATFQVNSSVKKIVRNEYCIGSPQNTPHILLQQYLAPGEKRTLKLPLEVRRYRWRAPRLAGKSALPRTLSDMTQLASGRALLEANTDTRNEECAVILDENGLHLLPDEVGAGVVTFTLQNDSQNPQVVLLEQTDWSDQASTAAEVTSLQTFRDLFSSEALRPGESISVESLAILFTDLKGSTAMYRTVGDAPAFRRVMDHFSILRDGVSLHHGGLVKTIGDAIMAVFRDPADAVRAALDILDGIQTHNDGHPAAPLVLKMGIHQGACIAVTLNERLDYFGTVVNLAARLEGQSQGDDVVISEAVASDPTVGEVLQERGVQVESFSAIPKGFSESFSLRRLTPARSGKVTSPAGSLAASSEELWRDGH